MRRWKAWERETQTTDYQVANGMIYFFSSSAILQDYLVDLEDYVFIFTTHN